MSNKRAFLVMGPEASGTKMLTQLLINCGCHGEAGHLQKMDDLVFDDQPATIVLRRSLPHGDEWPDISQITQCMKSAGYNVVYLTIIRDKDCCVASQLREQHEIEEEFCRFNIPHALEIIFRSAADHNILPKVILYEPFVKEKCYREMVIADLGLQICNPMEFHDANVKYNLNQNPLLVPPGYITPEAHHEQETQMQVAAV